MSGKSLQVRGTKNFFSAIQIYFCLAMNGNFHFVWQLSSRPLHFCHSICQTKKIEWQS